MRCRWDDYECTLQNGLVDDVTSSRIYGSTFFARDLFFDRHVLAILTFASGLSKRSAGFALVDTRVC